MRKIERPPRVLVSGLQKMLFARKLRLRMTPAESKLWNVLRAKRCAGIKFRRQVVRGHFIVDFCTIEHRLIIEVDGGIHDTQQEYDAKRQKILEEEGFTVIRFRNKEVMHDFAEVLQKIAQVVGSISANNTTTNNIHPLSPPGEG